MSNKLYVSVLFFVLVLNGCSNVEPISSSCYDNCEDENICQSESYRQTEPKVENIEVAIKKSSILDTGRKTVEFESIKLDGIYFFQEDIQLGAFSGPFVMGEKWHVDKKKNKIIVPYQGKIQCKEKDKCEKECIAATVKLQKLQDYIKAAILAWNEATVDGKKFLEFTECGDDCGKGKYESFVKFLAVSKPYSSSWIGRNKSRKR